jgi:hypothetical protein
VLFGEFGIGDERFPGFTYRLELDEELDWKPGENIFNDLDRKSGKWR